MQEVWTLSRNGFCSTKPVEGFGYNLDKLKMTQRAVGLCESNCPECIYWNFRRPGKCDYGVETETSRLYDVLVPGSYSKKQASYTL